MVVGRCTSHTVRRIVIVLLLLPAVAAADIMRDADARLATNLAHPYAG